MRKRVFDLSLTGDAPVLRCALPASLMVATERRIAENTVSALPALRFEISEASRMLRMSRAQLYHRIGEGAIRIQKDGARAYITIGELERYVKSCDARQITPDLDRQLAPRALE